ncbi:MAG: prolipoprotein diacylglyceryl transferase [Planctomycetes bacterium]|nr:prolipoprotein diacylglyceryl transferase [Planctomycetota bacterium]
MGPLTFPAWDPVLIDLPGPIDVRWYGLMYIVGFACAHWLLVRLARARFLPVDPVAVGDLIVYAVVGTILGGRLGYALFYDQGLADPLKLVRIWEGGLAFHGGLIGVAIAMALFARRHRVRIGRVFDATALAVTPGIFAVRCANFINGELFGRTTSAEMPFAMRFPTDPRASALLQLDTLRELGGKRAEELGVLVAWGKRPFEDLVAYLPRDPDGKDWASLRAVLDWSKVQEQVPWRHPSQLYEAAGEGIFCGLVLLVVYLFTRRRPLPRFTYCGIFLCSYAAVRFALENFRQPDAQFRGPDDELGTVLLGLTMGQTLCAVMLLAGFVAIGYGLTRGREPNEVPAT